MDIFARITGVKYTPLLCSKYYLTCDEVEIHGDEIYLVEAKHTNKDELPSRDNIKDGLVKMILFMINDGFSA